MNRLTQLLQEEPEERRELPAFWEIETSDRMIPVSPATAHAVELALDADPPPAWITFRDLAGARYRLLVGDIRSVVESGPAHRHFRRAFQHARLLEAQAEAEREGWEEE